MNVLKLEKKKQVLNSLIEGCSIRSTERMTGAHRDTIMRLLIKTGNTCQKLLDEKVRDFHSKFIQVDEIWCYVLKKEKIQSKEEKLSGLFGDQYCFVAMDAESKLVPSFRIGKRNSENAVEFIADLKDKLQENRRIQLTSDGWKAYPDAVDLAFGGDVDFAQLIKVYAGVNHDKGKYSPSSLKGVLSKIFTGKPNTKKISTSHIERQNLTMRMQMRRFTRLTNGFSKKVENLKSAVALHFAHYNFMRIHRSLRYTPAMAAGITSHIWEWEDIL